MLIGWPSGYPNVHNTPKSHLILNQVNLPSSAIAANEKSSTKFEFQPYCKTIDDWSSIPERVMFTALQVSFFYQLRHNKVQKSYTTFNNQDGWKIIFSNANWTRKENLKYLTNTEQSEFTSQPIPFPYRQLITA